MTSGGHTQLGAGAEFDAIREIIRRLGVRARGIGDDAAVLDVPDGERLVASTDAAIEDVHFRRGWLTPAEIGWRAAMAALSDLAAMGATPLGVLVALAAPEGWREALADLMAGAGEAAETAGAPIVGGNLARASSLTITTTVLGSARSPVSRAGARPGDTLWLTGRLGGPALVLHALEIGAEPDAAARVRFARPVARIGEGQWLAAQGACAAIDISDGLAADAAQIAAASGVHAVLDLERVPRVGNANAREAAASGEEYELLVAAPATLDASAFAERFRLPLTRIGRVEQGAGVELREDGVRVAPLGGHDHFSR